jgi:16S rRNA (adenine1518-N6/adenine1519-N6)-dimethyltransferase
MLVWNANQIRNPRRFGQHFLIDRSVLNRIVEYATLKKNETILEIGAGTGNLTAVIQRHVGKVIAIEKDHRLAALLQQRFQNNCNVKVILGDILKLSLPVFDKVVASPPYSISSKLIFLLLKRNVKSMILVLQKEFALRLVADPGSTNYGRLTVAVTHKANTELLDFVPKTAFRPIPRVDSFIVRITPKIPIASVNERFLNQMMLYLFSQRRRTLKGVLRRAMEKRENKALQGLVESKDLLNKRVFQLTTSDFENLSNYLYPQRKLFKLLNK